ncbi:RNA polymerase sigma factor [Pedobacter psychrodurus]|uniref:RNA polymerase sigma factor n=1 Tax=Pedobacter psychrodurus TaxID=2530456 RepID=A0A4V2MQV1_9SPHI|nr:RNA polymerase sigma factor [Pedobacter psychrodurus]TCD26555.1 RNA polymerase sigma factor [Pedobacter psychrodurus]
MTQKEFSETINFHASSLRLHALNFTRDTEDANDLLQDTLLKATRFFSKFEDGTNIKGWLFVIMKNTFINSYRKNLKTRDLTVQEEEITSANLYFSATTNASEGNFALQDINRALALLPEKYSAPFIRYFEGYKYHEIAEEMQLPLGTVKTYIHEARILLKRYLKQYQA